MPVRVIIPVEFKVVLCIAIPLPEPGLPVPVIVMFPAVIEVGEVNRIASLGDVPPTEVQ